MVFNHVPRDSTLFFVCPSVGPSVRRSISPCVHYSVGPSEGWSIQPVFFSFLVTYTHFYKRLCRSVHWSVRRSVRRSFRRSIRRSVCWSKMHKSKSGNMIVLDALLGISVGEGAWAVDRGWMPLPTRPQRYCDPASLVTLGNSEDLVQNQYFIHRS